MGSKVVKERFEWNGLLSCWLEMGIAGWNKYVSLVVTIQWWNMAITNSRISAAKRGGKFSSKNWHNWQFYLQLINLINLPQIAWFDSTSKHDSSCLPTPAASLLSTPSRGMYSDDCEMTVGLMRALMKVEDLKDLGRSVIPRFRTGAHWGWRFPRLEHGHF